ncbi:hypothetical protein [Pararhizobium sp. PWRC1-1]|uniref:hypothetical protein n=1 Tax=Pararhizobium sp. PWRC1-1 TaxID=2804566 RepID=UPI003CF354E2
MLVEDDALIRMSVTDMVDELGFQVSGGTLVGSYEWSVGIAQGLRRTNEISHAAAEREAF